MSFAQTDRRVQRRKAAKPNLYRRNRSARPQRAILLGKQFVERVMLVERMTHFDPSLAYHLEEIKAAAADADESAAISIAA
jgi:hypothetical protein